MKKYEITEEYVMFSGRKLFRIRAMKDFSDVKAGDPGGYIEKEKNLAQDGDAWVSDNAYVCDDAHVYGNAWVYDAAKIGGNAKIEGDAYVCDDAHVYGNARVGGNAQVYGDAKIEGNARVGGNAQVYGDAKIEGNAQVYGDAWVYGNVHVCDDARVGGDAQICGDAHVCGNAKIEGNAYVCGKAWVRDIGDYATLMGFGSKHRVTTFFRQKDGTIGVNCGCFYGKLPRFREKVKETHGDTKFAKEYLMAADLMEMHFSVEER